jgi:diguanylate cyclase (GGDEF)-like protein/PAS domain S-box-containing protein
MAERKRSYVDFLLSRLNAEGQRRSWGVSVLVLVLYFPLLLLLHSVLGTVSLAAVFVPGLIWAVLLGPTQAMVGTFLLAIPNFLIFSSLNSMRAPGDNTQLLISHIVIGLITYVVGYGYVLRKALSSELDERKTSEARFRALFDKTNDAIFILGLDMIIKDVNEQAAKMLGYSVGELLGMDHHEIVIPEEHENLDIRLDQLLAGENLPFYERTYRRKDGSQMRAEVNAALVYDGFGRPHHIQSLSRDITDRKAAEAFLYFQATHDDLTGLHNRAMFVDYLLRAVERSDRQRTRMAILFMDLDGFKKANDTLGHAFGDFILKEAAHRLRAQVRTGDVTARMGGDEFAVGLEAVSSRAIAQMVAGKIERAFGLPFEKDGRSANVSVSVGISLFPEDAKNADDLLKAADDQMYAIKREKKEEQA